MQGASAISPMQKLCLLKLVRPVCLVSAIQQYVVASLGPRFAEPGPVSLAQVSKDSNNTTPIIFILSAGALNNSCLSTRAGCPHDTRSDLQLKCPFHVVVCAGMRHGLHRKTQWLLNVP